VQAIANSISNRAVVLSFFSEPSSGHKTVQVIEAISISYIFSYKSQPLVKREFVNVKIDSEDFSLHV
jgi:hypothetical protein